MAAEAKADAQSPLTLRERNRLRTRRERLDAESHVRDLNVEAVIQSVVSALPTCEPIRSRRSRRRQQDHARRRR